MLEEVYLQGNSLTDIKQVVYLAYQRNLKKVFFKHGLDENPMCKAPNYRQKCFEFLPKNVEVLDFGMSEISVTEEDRKLMRKIM